jgi:hypothetical protein
MIFAQAGPVGTKTNEKTTAINLANTGATSTRTKK